LRVGQNFADGCVKSVEDQFLVCEIYTSNGNVDVRLPKDLIDFAEPPSLGLPIRLEMTDRDGYRTATLTKRVIERTDDAEIDALVDRLG